MEQQRTGTPSQAHSSPKRVPALESVTARLRIEVPGSPSRILEVRDGTVAQLAGNGKADAVLTFENEQSFDNVMTGKENLVVVALQGRLRWEGDLLCATRVLLALNAAGKASGGSAEVRS